MPQAPPQLQLPGHLIEGEVKLDPETGRYVIALSDDHRFDVQEALRAFEGKTVRLTLVGLEDLANLAQLVERQGGGQVQGIRPEDIGIPWGNSRKS